MAKKHRNPSSEAVTLRTLAECVGLAPCSVSAILNNTAAGRSIPQHTRDRVRRAALQLNYQPNYSARSLRTRRSYTIALLTRDIGYAPAARIIAGAETFLRGKGYCLLITTYDGSPDWMLNQFTSLRQRGVEGIVAVQARVPLPPGFPSVFVDTLRVPEPISIVYQEKLQRIGHDYAERLVRRIENRGRDSFPALYRAAGHKPRNIAKPEAQTATMSGAPSLIA